MNIGLLSRVSVLGAFFSVLLVACSDREPTPPPITAASTGGSGTVTVTAANPDSAQQDTTLDVHVLGSGFDRGSNAQWAQSGVPSPNVKTNSTKFVSSGELVANITIAVAAGTGAYDILVTTSKGKKGIGTDLFTIGKKSTPPADPAITFFNNGLWVMNADGSNPALVTTSGGLQPSWAPFGKGSSSDPYAIAFSSASCQIARIDVAVVAGAPVGSNFQTLANPFAGCEQYAAWSPKGDSVAVSELPRSSGAPSALWLLAAAGGSGARLVYAAPPNYLVQWSAWSPDGSRIAFVEEDDSGPCCSYPRSIKVVDVQTRAVTVVLAPGSMSAPRFVDWARTKDVLVFEAEGRRTNFLYTLNLNPLGAPIQLAGGSFPTWSPDDSKVAYQGINVVDVATGIITSLSKGPGGVGGTWPDWRR